MKTKNLFIMAAAMLSTIFINFNALAMSPETEMLLKLLEKKGIVTADEAADLKQAVEASVEQKAAPGKVHTGRMNITDRLARLENQVAKTAVVNDFLERVEISGLIEVEGYAASRGSGNNNRDSSDITLATVELEIDARINEWVSGHLLLLYEEDDTEDFTVDEGIITIGNTAKFPFYLSAGKMYVPFGNFESNMIQDPLTLELGESRESAVQIGFEAAGFYGSIYAFNGDVGETDDNNKVDNYGANLGFTFERDQCNLDIGVGYINNITDADTMTDALDGFTAGGKDFTEDYVSGFASHLIINMGPFQLIGEYVGAVEEYTAGEMGTKSVRPESWNIEAAFTQELLGKETTFALAYQGTHDSLAIELPENRYMGAIGINILENTALKIEYMHDVDYGKHEGGTDQRNDTVSAQVAITF
jgi:hypothetical protein